MQRLNVAARNLPAREQDRAHPLVMLGLLEVHEDARVQNAPELDPVLQSRSHLRSSSTEGTNVFLRRHLELSLDDLLSVAQIDFLHLLLLFFVLQLLLLGVR